MASLRTLKRRIKSIKSINEITKAMEMISAVRFKRVEGRLKRSLPYTQAIEGLIARILSEDAVAGHPLFRADEKGAEILIVITGDRGLCGSFNTNVLRRAENYIQLATRPVEVLVIGKVGIAFAKRRGWRMWDTLQDVGYKFTPDSLAELTRKVSSAFVTGKFSYVNVLMMELVRSGIQRPALEPFLSLRHLIQKRDPKDAEVEYTFEPNRVTTLGTLVELYVRQRVFITLLRSVAAEYSARMIAMKLASDNGKDLIKELTLERNKIRQAMITKEISEIIGGVSALS